MLLVRKPVGILAGKLYLHGRRGRRNVPVSVFGTQDDSIPCLFLPNVYRLGVCFLSHCLACDSTRCSSSPTVRMLA